MISLALILKYSLISFIPPWWRVRNKIFEPIMAKFSHRHPLPVREENITVNFMVILVHFREKLEKLPDGF